METAEKISKPITKRGGARPNSGGRRDGAGRKKGVPNKATAEIKTIAQQYGPQAIAVLAELMMQAQTEQTRVSAAKELLDRGYGKSAQAITGPEGAPLMPPVIQFVLDADPAE